MRVLVVEDHREMARLIEQHLREEGFSVEVASTGEDAVSFATEYELDAVVLDVLLPGIDGFETCRRIREAGAWAPILMLTARDAVEDRVRGERLIGLLGCGTQRPAPSRSSWNRTAGRPCPAAAARTRR